MQILGIMLVKDEADIIRHTLEAAGSWADRIFVLDNGSTDGTWEIVKDLSSRVIVPWKQDFRTYSNALRAEVFAEFRHESRDGDWWCYKMDSDEFYVDDPRSFLSHVPHHHHTVYKRSIDYQITVEDVEEYTFTGDFAHDRANLQYFRPNAICEPRFFRYRSRLRWRLDRKSPDHMGIPHSQPITVRHFRWRSPEQMQKRIDIRKAIPRDKRGKPFRHERHSEWREALERRDDLTYEAPGFDFSSVPLRRSLKLPWPQYVARRILHGIRLFP